MQKRWIFLKAGLWACVFALFSGTPTFAQQLVGGGLSVSPNRVIFEGRDRFHQVTLLNRGKKATSYKIRLVTTRMDEKGDVKETANEDRAIKEAKRLIRYAPRRVKLNAGQGQIIRLSVRKPKGLEEGEYRSNMVISAIPEDKAPVVKAPNPDAPNAVTIQVTAFFAISIPVMVRHGKLYATSRVEGLELLPADPAKKQPLRIKSSVIREGNRTTYGDAVVKYIAPSGGEPVIVGQIINTGVYPPLPKRELIFPLTVPDGTKLSPGGTLEMTYSDKPRRGDKTTPPSVVSMTIK